MTIQTSHIGLMLVDLINDHAQAAEGDELPTFSCTGHHLMPDAQFETCEARAPEADYSNVLVELDNGQKFRVQVIAC